MFARSRWGTNLGLLVAAGCVAGWLACASSPPGADADEPTGTTLSALGVESDGFATDVTFVGVDQTAVRVEQHEEPWAISVDLPGVGTDGGILPVAVYDGTVDQVSAASFTDAAGETRTRVEIALSGQASYEVVSTEAGLTLRVVPESSTAWDMALAPAQSATGVSDVQDFDAIDPYEVDALVAQTQERPVVVFAGPPPIASGLDALRVQTVPGGVLFHLMADGIIEEMESFLLEDPDRLVIDLPGLVSRVVRSRRSVDSPAVSRVRVGAHDDRVRVVMDRGAAPNGFDGKRFMPVSDGLFVALGEGEAVEEAFAAGVASSEAAWLASLQTSPGTDVVWTPPATAPPGPAQPAPFDDGLVPALGVATVPAVAPRAPLRRAPPIEAAPTQEPADQAIARSSDPDLTIFGVEYHTDFDRKVERIAVLANGRTEFDWVEPDAETVLIRLPNAKMADEVAGGLAPREGGPISLIRAFEQPEVEPAEVRIVITREAGVVPQIEAVGHNLFIDFGFREAEPVAAAPVETRHRLARSDTSGAPQAPLDPAAPRMPTAPVASQPSAVGEAGRVSPPASISPNDSVPASLEAPAAIDVLQEGGLIDGKEYRGRRISLDFKDVEIEDVLRLIAEVSDLNIISGDEVSGKVSIRLVDVPWDQALDVILLTKGLGFVRVGNVLRIAPSDVIAQEEEVRLQERRAKEKLEDLVVKLIPVNYGDIQSMQKLVTRLLTPRGSVNVDERTSTLIVKDIASVIEEATTLIAAVDTETPQVMIEAKVVEASLDFSRELGSAWAVGQVGNPALGNDDFRFSAPPGSEGSIYDSNNVSVMNQIASSPTAAFNLSALLLDDKFNFDVQIQAAESTGNGKVVSSPRVVTMDNREATVEQGVSIPFQTFENGDAQLQFVDATLSLTVTPHITSDESIIMAIEVTHDAPDTKVPTSTGSPAISKNQAKTETLVKNGQTLVLGGIYTVEKTMTQSRVPYLHRIPLLGAAFQSKSVVDKRKELLIFVTPRIVVQPQDAG